jgi:hypothetical protein
MDCGSLKERKALEVPELTRLPEDQVLE